MSGISGYMVMDQNSRFTTEGKNEVKHTNTKTRQTRKITFTKLVFFYFAGKFKLM